jgi:hypothetical protein
VPPRRKIPGTSSGAARGVKGIACGQCVEDLMHDRLLDIEQTLRGSS